MVDILNTAGAGAGTSTAPEGHDQAMLDAVDKRNAELQGQEQESPEGELILGKFKTPEDLATAYQELEKKLGGKTEDKPEGETGDQTEDKPEDTAEDEAEKAVESAGLNMADLSASYDETGDLTEDQYAALEKAGITRDYVADFIAGQEARGQLIRESILGEVGGEDEFGQMVEWAATNLSPEDQEAYNKAVDSRDLATVKSAVTSLAYKYQKANGIEPSLIGGDSNDSGGDVFESTAQMTEAMRDPRYDKDPAFRQAVADKLARSSIF